MKKHLLSKWLFYSGACLLVFLFEAGVLPRLPLASVRPLLLPLSVATIASLEGVSAGATFGLFAGILSFLFLPGTHSFSIFLFSLLCFLSAFSPLAPRVWPFLRALFASSLALLLLSAFQILVFLLRYQATLSSPLRSATSPLFGLLPSGLCHSPFALPTQLCQRRDCLDRIKKANPAHSGCCSFFLFILVFSGNLLFLQVVKGEDYATLAREDASNTEAIPVARGRISDRNGRLLVSDQICWNVALDPGQMGEGRDEILRALFALCQKYGVSWRDSLPVSKTAPYHYTKDLLGSQDLEHYQQFRKAIGLVEPGKARDLLDVLGERFSVPSTISPQTKRFFVGVLYESALREEGILWSDFLVLEAVNLTFFTELQELSLPGVQIQLNSSKWSIYFPYEFVVYFYFLFQFSVYFFFIIDIYFIYNLIKNVSVKFFYLGIFAKIFYKLFAIFLFLCYHFYLLLK